MSSVQPTRKDKRGASKGWIWRMAFGLGLIGLNCWGVRLCQQFFRTYITSIGPTAFDVASAALAAWVAWFVFFGPIGAAGLILLSSALRKLGALDRLGAFWERIGGAEDSHDVLESLSDEKMAQLTMRAQQTAILLGLFAGAFFVLLGVFGLIFATQAMPLRLTIDFGIASGISILAGLAILRHTLSKQDNAWLLPLKLFTQRVLRLHAADNHKARRPKRVR